MFHRDRDSGAGFTTGVFAGLLFGAGLALLIAPKAGADLRGDIGESVGSLRNAVNRRYRDLATRAGTTIDNLQDRVHRATEAFEAGARELVQTAERRGREPITSRGDTITSRHDLPRA